MSEIPDNNTQEMSTFAYALLENYEVFGKTEDEYELGTRDKLIQYIGGLEHDLTNKEIEYTDLWDDALAFQARIAELEKDVEYWRNRHGKLLEFVAGKEG